MTIAEDNVHQCSCKQIELNTKQELTCPKCKVLNTQQLICSKCEGDTSQPCSLKAPRLKCSKCGGRGCTEEVPSTNASNSTSSMNCPKCECNPEEQGSASPDPPPKGQSRFLKVLGVGCCAAVGSVVAIAAAPVVLTAVGFTSGGIAASSIAASMMSSAAVANGGGIAAGSLVAVLQSAGAAGLGTAGVAATGTAGAAMGGLMGGVGFKLKNLFTKDSKDSGNGKNSSNDDHGDDQGTASDKEPHQN